MYFIWRQHLNCDVSLRKVSRKGSLRWFHAVPLSIQLMERFFRVCDFRGGSKRNYRCFFGKHQWFWSESSRVHFIQNFNIFSKKKIFDEKVISTTTDLLVVRRMPGCYGDVLLWQLMWYGKWRTLRLLDWLRGVPSPNVSRRNEMGENFIQTHFL